MNASSTGGPPGYPKDRHQPRSPARLGGLARQLRRDASAGAGGGGRRNRVWDRSWDGMGQEIGMDTSVLESIGMEDV